MRQSARIRMNRDNRKPPIACSKCGHVGTEERTAKDDDGKEYTYEVATWCDDIKMAYICKKCGQRHF